MGSLLASGFYKFIKMLEYETANPGQDSSKEEGEHFNPDLDQSQPRVSIALDDYAHATDGTHGTPREYGSARRPFSESPAPPHPSDQFVGLASGGMHADEYVKPTAKNARSGSESDHTLAATATPPATTAAGYAKPGIKAGTAATGQPANHSSARTNMYHNQNMNDGIPRDDEFYDKV